MKKLHSIDEPMFGRLSTVLHGKGEYSWSKALWAMYIEWKSVAVPSGKFTDEEFDQFEKVLRKEKELLDAVKEPKLTHCDLWENNVLAKREGEKIVITAIIDIDRAFCGDPEFEFGYEFMLTDAFKEGYGGLKQDADSVRRRKIYRMLCSLNDAYIWYTEYSDMQSGDSWKRVATEAAAALP